jgi:hypothetical protein
MTSRDIALKELLDFSKPIDSLNIALQSFEWDFDGIPFRMTRGHLQSVLLRYMDGHLAAHDVENWANLIEGREDIDFELGHENALSQYVYELANPDLLNELSLQRAEEIIRLINQKNRIH